MNKEILRLAIPNIISNISVPLLSTVDTALMGRMSEIHVGAVGLGSMVFNFVYWNFGFLRMGTTGLTAQAFGRLDKSQIIHTVARALAIALVMSLLVVSLQVPLCKASLYLMNVSESQSVLLQEYFYIRIWAAPATIGLYAIFGWYFGMQNAIYPLILTILINIVNVVFNFIFIYGYGMEVDGVAWGTVVAQYAGLLFGIFLFFKKYREYLKYFQKKVFAALDAIKFFMKVNRDIFIRTLFLTFVFAFFHSKSSVQDDMTLAANIILLQFLNWMSFGIDGFAYASESLVGKYHGAQNPTKTHTSIRYSFYWGLVAAVLYSLFFWILEDPLLNIFTNQPEVIAATKPYTIWIILMPILAFWCYIWDGVYIGLTASVSMRNTMAVSLLLFLAAYYILVPIIGNHGLWLALMIFLAGRGIMQTLLFRWKGLNMR